MVITVTPEIENRWVTVTQTDHSYDETTSLTIPRDKLPSERTRLTVPWMGEQIVWDSSSIPFSLRESNKVLFIIGFDRDTDFSKPRLRYYRQLSTKFEEIKPDEFPKAIATQNMWLSPDAKSRGTDNKLHYDLQMARDIDPDDEYFHDSLTARVWAHLTTGKDYHEQDRRADAKTLKAFKRTNSPIPLPTIIRTPANWPTDE